MQASSTTHVTYITYDAGVFYNVCNGCNVYDAGLFYNGSAILWHKPPYDQEGWCCDAESAGHPPFRCTRCKPAWPEVLTDAATVEVAAAPPAALDFAGRRQVLLKTPQVVKWGRAHFGCESLAGVELEDDGGPGTAGSHWEKRHLMNEFMAGSPRGEKSIRPCAGQCKSDGA